MILDVKMEIERGSVVPAFFAFYTDFAYQQREREKKRQEARAGGMCPRDCRGTSLFPFV